PDRPFPSAPPPSVPRSADPIPADPIPADPDPADPTPVDEIDIPLDEATVPLTTPATSSGQAPPPPAEPDADPPPSRPAGSAWGDFGGTPEPDEHAADVITAYPSARPGPAGAIHGVGITVLVTDLNRSITFYRDILGFFEIDSGDGSAVLASGDTRLVLRTVHNLADEAGRLIYLNLEVGDVHAVYDELRGKNVKFVHSPRAVNRGDKLELWSATFRDPDNHNIAITQWKAIR
ncbi:VOC family protein, partial [Actinoplanes sp. GCM10030250]|uniref:VOC family protein n=1 Tax=Actinoplanes sp. GCM10030250 TaxID=3273376 RepID=UPI00361D5440